MDIEGLNIEQLEALEEAVKSRLNTLRVLEAIPIQVAELVTTYLEASDRGSGKPWVQPEGSHDAYPIGWIVTHLGKTWTSLTDNNAHAPGVSGWREEVPAGSGPAEWVQPSGAHDAYQAGDLVTFEGQVYRSTIDGNVWEPGTPEAINLSLWEDMTPAPEPDPEMGISAWAPGTDYLYGDNVMYGGVQYVVQLAHRSQPDWLPPNVPALYTMVG